MRPRPPANLDRLPRFPAPIARALRHVRDREVSADALARLLSTEEDLVECILRGAAHPIFGGRGEARSVDVAIARLGRSGFHDLLFSAAVLPLFREPFATLDAAALRTHSLACGVLARDLAMRLRVAEPGEAFRAGLVHDIGLLAIGATARQASSRAAARSAERGESLVEAEEVMTGRDHCLYGQWYGEALDLEASAIEAVRHHHAPEEASAPRALPALICLCDHLSRADGMGYGFAEGLASVNESHPAWRLLCDERAGLGEKAFSSLAAEAVSRLNGVREAAALLVPEPVPA